MGIFATYSRKRPVALQGRSEQIQGQPSSLQAGLPARFEAVGESLSAGTDTLVACAVVGRDLARDGADLGAALQGLRSTYAQVMGGEPDFGATQALSVAWGEETLAYVHQLSCENPMTGLASLAHVRARLAEIYRGVKQDGGSVTTSHALVVIDLPVHRGEESRADQFGHTLWLVKLAETVRTVFPGHQTIGQIGRSRLVVMTERTELLGHLVSALRGLIEDVDPRGPSVRVWIEGLPASDDAAASLLDELART